VNVPHSVDYVVSGTNGSISVYNEFHGLAYIDNVAAIEEAFPELVGKFKQDGSRNVFVFPITDFSHWAKALNIL
jgi:hypothetical protein